MFTSIPNSGSIDSWAAVMFSEIKKNAIVFAWGVEINVYSF